MKATLLTGTTVLLLTFSLAGCGSNEGEETAGKASSSSSAAPTPEAPASEKPAAGEESEHGDADAALPSSKAPANQPPAGAPTIEELGAVIYKHSTGQSGNTHKEFRIAVAECYATVLLHSGLSKEGLWAIHSVKSTEEFESVHFSLSTEDQSILAGDDYISLASECVAVVGKEFFPSEDSE